MYRFAYQDVGEITCKDARQRERDAIVRSVEMLRSAMRAGLKSRETVEAVHYVQRLWMVLLEDLCADDNDLPRELKAQLISVGLWLIRTAEDIRFERSDALEDMMTISQSIADGLK